PARRYFLDSAYCVHQVFQRICVAEANVAFAEFAECAAAQAGYAGLVQKKVGQFLRAHTRFFDVGKRIERATRDGAAESGDRIETFAEGVAAAAELRHHAVY